MAVTTTSRDGIAVITFDNPPVNGMGLAVRRGIADAIAAANADDAIAGIVITGGGKVFSGGADIKEFNTPRAEQAPNLHDVIAAVEASPKPVCIAINGTALGGGMELSLGANYRVAHAKAEVGLPEVKIGILPGAGGTQRLPRVVGLETALNMIVSGASVPAANLARTALFDAVVDGDVVDAAVDLLKQKIAGGGPHPRVRDRKVEHDDAEAFIAWARMGVAAASKDFPAPLRCVDAVAACAEPFDQGMAVEREDLCRAAGHARIEGAATCLLRRTRRRQDPRRAVRTYRHARSQGGRDRRRHHGRRHQHEPAQRRHPGGAGWRPARRRWTAAWPPSAKNYEASAKQGQPDRCAGRAADGAADTIALLRRTWPTATWSSRRCTRTMRSSNRSSEKIDAVAKPGAILASNTSTLDVDRIAAFTKRPQDVLGLHFFSAGQCHAPARSGARQRHREGRDGHCDGAGQAHSARPRWCRQLRRLHRQPHDRAVQPPGRLPAGGRRAAAAGGRAMEASASRWGRSGWATWPATTSAGRSASGVASNARHGLSEERFDLLCEMGRYRPEDRQAGWYDYRAGRPQGAPVGRGRG
jgi:3-hydroxyacyl-CoA dehydrogenase